MQVIKKYIYLSGKKSRDPLHHIVNVPNIFKFTKISAKGTQERQRRPNITISKICHNIYICHNSKMTSLHYFPFFI